ncbi:MAG: type II secretion system F family protein [Candidatus Omnitrophica bacterium]|nr:type II secretion system F family protein [Candidatus Omnitrophota bacterium]
MPIYKYRAKKDPQHTVEGEIDALNENEAVEKLSQIGYLPISLHLVKEGLTPKPAPFRLLGKIKPRQITVFTRQLASLLKAGVPILTSINILKEQSESIPLNNLLKRLHDRLNEGATFSASLEEFPQVFPSLYVAMIRSGEDSGTLTEVLLKIADYRTKQEEILQRLRTALVYPLLMAVVGIATIIFMLTFVMPRLMSIFANLQEELPLPTKLLLWVSKTLKDWGLWLIIILGMIILMLRRQAMTESGRLSLARWQLRIPILGGFILKNELARFSRTLELLLKNGLSILKAIEVAIPVLRNALLKQELLKSSKDLQQGGSFGRSLKNSALFPSFMSNLVLVGEESGALADSLAEVAQAYEGDTEETIRIFLSLLEPLLILGMGLIVGFIVIAMLLPIFQINVMAR